MSLDSVSHILQQNLQLIHFNDKITHTAAQLLSVLPSKYFQRFLSAGLRVFT